jgi:amidase
MLRTLARVLLLSLSLCEVASMGTASGQAAPYSVEEKSVAELQSDLQAGRVTSEQLVRLYTDRINAIDKNGPALRSVISLNPHALDDARKADADRKAGKNLGLLQGVPVLIKDNIDSNDGLPTTAGSGALIKNITNRDAPVVARMRAAGAIVLGKTNLSEWANIRSTHSISGWSGVGGLVKNPYALDRSACGSSSGTGAAIAASLAAVGVGTETDGSVTCPSSINGLAGLKPTVGLVSRTHVVPISHTQDTPGPMGRSVSDIAALLTAMAGSDPADPATAKADAHKTDYVKALDGATLRGKRLGVLRYATGQLPAVDGLFEKAIAFLKQRGATIVEIKTFKPDPALGDLEFTVLLYELKADLNAYLATTPATVKTRTLADVIAFDNDHDRESGLFDQDIFEKAQATSGLKAPKYLQARAKAKRLAGAEGIDMLLGKYKLDALIAPGDGPASRIDVVTGDHFTGGGAAQMPAVAGYPHLSVPMGLVDGLPVGLNFIGPAWSEAKLLQLGFAYEQAARARIAPQYVPSVEGTKAVQDLFAPFGVP